MEVRVFSWAYIMNLCPCCSGKPYSECCQPLHDGALAESALQLMRSRYSAYALNKPDYIIRTTHPSNPHYSPDRAAWKKNISHFSKVTKFDRLAIRDFQESSDQATVTFTAYLTQNDQDATFTEKSSFEKVDGAWVYLDALMHHAGSSLA